MPNLNPPSPMEKPDAAHLVRELRREVERHAAGRADIAHFAAWVRTRLDVIAEQLTPPTPAHRSRAAPAKARLDSRTLN
jgi:hypothetical protein